MPKIIHLTPTEMTPEAMQELEDRKLIIRLYPGHHVLHPKHNETLSASIYESEPRYGPHKLIVATINWYQLSGFGYHDDNEEFLLLGDPSTRPLYLVVARCKKDELEAKIQSSTLGADDFIALRVKYNDPLVSFFTMLKDVPHGEVTEDGSGRPPSFYVTEPRDMGIHLTDFGPYELRVG
jgi:hypothetical protein